MVSDGSFKNSWGTAALIIDGGKISHLRITATSTTPGHPEYQEAYWRKLSGILRVIITRRIPESSSTLTEDPPSDVIKCTGIGHHLQQHPTSTFPNTWNPQHQDSESTERYIARAIHVGTSIVVSDGNSISPNALKVKKNWTLDRYIYVCLNQAPTSNHGRIGNQP